MDREATVILIAVILAAAIGLFFLDVGNTGQSLNINIQPEKTSYLQSEGEVAFPVSVSFYLGSGWDNACYRGVIVSYIQDRDTKDIVFTQEWGMYNPNHNANQKNVPYVLNPSLIVDMSKFKDGIYELEMHGFISGINDRPNIGACDSDEPWIEQLDHVNNQVSLEQDPIRWIEVMNQQPYIYDRGSDSQLFTVGDSNQCDVLCKLIEFLNGIFNKLGIVVTR